MILVFEALVFDALGDPVRRRILEHLATGEQPVGALVTALQTESPISQPAVSQHLKVLREGGLVMVRAAGTRRLYTIDQAGVDTARAWLARLNDPLAPFAQPWRRRWLAGGVPVAGRWRGRSRQLCRSAAAPPDVRTRGGRVRADGSVGSRTGR
jgi:DNA-binding transcriptional ArsR family regulator